MSPPRCLWAPNSSSQVVLVTPVFSSRTHFDSPLLSMSSYASKAHLPDLTSFSCNNITQLMLVHLQGETTHYYTRWPVLSMGMLDLEVSLLPSTVPVQLQLARLPPCTLAAPSPSAKVTSLLWTPLWPTLQGLLLQPQLWSGFKAAPLPKARQASTPGSDRPSMQPKMLLMGVEALRLLTPRCRPGPGPRR